jgi:cysteine synthase
MADMIDLTIDAQGLARNIAKARENRVIIPTIAQMRQPETIPEKARAALGGVGLWDVDPLNLFRITWKNEPRPAGGLFRRVPNYLELPPVLTGVPARIICMAGKWFPTGCHKVGAAFGCLAPRLVTGQFDVERHRAVWPSTGNYCRGGAFNSRLFGARGVAILPAEMSQERFDWLHSIGAEVVVTPGGESNVKEIFDKTNELRRDPGYMIFNQFEEMGNPLWHYNVTGNALADLFESLRRPGERLAGVCFSSGSAGTLSAGDRLKELYHNVKLGVGEALQCPTILNNGFGAHRIEGIGDKHIPWVHNVRNTDLAIAIDDEDPLRLLRLFNTPEGRGYLRGDLALDDGLIDKLSWMGISGIANVLCCIKMAKYYELGERDIIATVLTDSAEMYGSRVRELDVAYGAYDEREALRDHTLRVLAQKTDHLLELTYPLRKRVHNLKYYTWVEQQGKPEAELRALWYDPEHTWDAVHAQAAALDELIDAFNAETGVLAEL